MCPNTNGLWMVRRINKMTVWTTKKLKYITSKIGSGATPRGGQESYHNEGTPLIRSLNIYDLNFNYSNLAFINDLQAKKLNNVTVEKDDVLLNITGASVCRCTSVPDNLVPARVNQHVSIIRADKINLIGKYLKYVLVSSIYKRLLYGLATNGATREALTKEDIENFGIELPDLPTQTRIASVLSAYDDLIENNQKRIKVLEEMAQMLYTEWFVKFKFPGHENVKMVDSGTSYGMVPEGWEVKKLKEIANVISGYAFKSSDFQKTGTPVIKIKNITSNNTVETTNTDFISSSIVNDRLSKYFLNDGDIIIAMTGATAGKIGRISTNELLLLNQRVAKIESFLGYYSFLWGSIETEEAQNKFYRLAGGAAQPNMSATQIENVEILVPDITLIKKYESIVSNMLKAINQFQKINSSLSKTRDLLIPQLVTGKREVK